MGFGGGVPVPKALVALGPQETALRFAFSRGSDGWAIPLSAQYAPAPLNADTRAPLNKLIQTWSMGRKKRCYRAFVTSNRQPR